MSKLPIKSLFKIILDKNSSKKFLLGTIGSFSFSIAVILATIGLMDGFEFTLKQALSHANGDIKFSSKARFFKLNEKIEQSLKEVNVKSYSTLLETEAFAVHREDAKGVLLRGIDPKYFSNEINLNFSDLKDGVYIGKELQRIYDVKVGDSIRLVISPAGEGSQKEPFLRNFVIQGIVEHGIYEKDLRFIYIEKRNLEKLLGFIEGTSNRGIITLKPFSNLENTIKQLKMREYEEFNFAAYWSEFDVLLDAVKMEKMSITLILQLIVVVAVLNIVGFIFYISETRSQEFFMLRALGLSLKSYKRFWFLLLLWIWLVSCLLSIGFVEILNRVVLKLPYLKIPGDIYVLSELKIILGGLDYLIVFVVSFIWIFIIGFFTVKKLEKKSLVSGLRQEFS